MKLLEGRLVFSGLLGGIDIDGNCGIFFNWIIVYYEN